MMTKTLRRQEYNSLLRNPGCLENINVRMKLILDKCWCTWGQAHHREDGEALQKRKGSQEGRHLTAALLARGRAHSLSSQGPCAFTILAIYTLCPTVSSLLCSMISCLRYKPRFIGSFPLGDLDCRLTL